MQKTTAVSVYNKQRRMRCFRMTKGKWFAFIAVLMLGLLMIPNVGEAEIDSGEGWELTDDWVLNIYANIETSHDYAPWSSYLSRVREIDIELGVTSIGDYAFDGFYYTKSISIPDSVTSIGNSAFSNCRSLSSIHIPDSVVFIGQDAFSSCNNLTSIYVDTLEQWLSYDHAATDLFPRSPSFGDNSLYVSGKLLTDAQILLFLSMTMLFTIVAALKASQFRIPLPPLGTALSASAQT